MLLAFAIAFAAAPATDVSQQPPEAKEERKICRREDNTGSRMNAKRICKTAAEWKAAQDTGIDASKLMNATRQQ